MVYEWNNKTIPLPIFSFCLLFLTLVGMSLSTCCEEAIAQPMNLIMGEAFIDEPIIEGTVTLYDKYGQVIKTQWRATKWNGTFMFEAPIALGDSFSAVLTGGTFLDRIGNRYPFYGRLVTYVTNFSNDSYIFLHPLSTMVVSYAETHFGKTIEDSKLAVKNFLQITRTEDFDLFGNIGHLSVTKFDLKGFMNEATKNGGLNPFINRLLIMMDRGQTKPFFGISGGKAKAMKELLLWGASTIAGSIAGEYIGKAMADIGILPDDEGEIDEKFNEINAKLNALERKIDELHTKIDDIQKEITKLNDQIAGLTKKIDKSIISATISPSITKIELCYLKYIHYLNLTKGYLTGDNGTPKYSIADDSEKKEIIGRLNALRKDISDLMQDIKTINPLDIHFGLIGTPNNDSLLRIAMELYLSEGLKDENIGDSRVNLNKLSEVYSEIEDFWSYYVGIQFKGLLLLMEYENYDYEKNESTNQAEWYRNMYLQYIEEQAIIFMEGIEWIERIQYSSMMSNDPDNCSNILPRHEAYEFINASLMRQYSIMIDLLFVPQLQNEDDYPPLTIKEEYSGVSHTAEKPMFIKVSKKRPYIELRDNGRYFAGWKPAYNFDAGRLQYVFTFDSDSVVPGRYYLQQLDTQPWGGWCRWSEEWNKWIGCFINDGYLQYPLDLAWIIGGGQKPWDHLTLVIDTGLFE